MRGRLLLLLLVCLAVSEETPVRSYANQTGFFYRNMHDRIPGVRRVKCFLKKIKALLPDIQGQMKNICHLISGDTVFGLFFENY